MKSPQNFDMRDLPFQRLIDALTQAKAFVPLSSAEKNWHEILILLPAGLQKALLDELTRGNRVASIQYGDWPQKGSVIVCLAEKFKVAYTRENPYGVTFRQMNDPHYWTADIHETINGVEHLIIY